MANQIIADGKVVNLIYSLKNAEGEVLDQADQETPFVYLHGVQQIVSGLESALDGLKVGDKKKVTVQPSDGYGELNADLKMTVPRSQFPATLEIEPGMQFEAQGPDGQGVVFTVEELVGDQIKVDGNHPLAGQTLHFDVEVLSMRDATEEEKAHGHSHGGDGHEHDSGHEHGEDCDHDHGEGEGGHHHH